MIVIDAFSSDSIPMHLLTREAIQLYLRKLAPGGLLVFHVSSEYLRLEPVLAALARDAGLACWHQDYVDVSPDDLRAGKLPSRWVVMARRGEDFGRLADDPRWHTLSAGSKAPVWTDDYSNFLSVVAWKRARAYGTAGRRSDSPGPSRSGA
jgi:hypothetical protein